MGKLDLTYKVYKLGRSDLVLGFRIRGPQRVLQTRYEPQDISNALELLLNVSYTIYSDR